MSLQNYDQAHHVPCISLYLHLIFVTNTELALHCICHLRKERVVLVVACFVSCIVNLEYEEVEMLAAACSGWGAMHCNAVKWAGQLAGH